MSSLEYMLYFLIIRTLYHLFRLCVINYLCFLLIIRTFNPQISVLLRISKYVSYLGALNICYI